MAKQLQIDNFFQKNQNAANEEISEHEQRLLNLTLRQFSKCTNVKDILTEDIKRKFSDPEIQKRQIYNMKNYVKAFYEKYQNNPKYRKHKNLKHLRIVREIIDDNKSISSSVSSISAPSCSKNLLPSSKVATRTSTPGPNTYTSKNTSSSSSSASPTKFKECNRKRVLSTSSESTILFCKDKNITIKDTVPTGDKTPSPLQTSNKVKTPEIQNESPRKSVTNLVATNNQISFKEFSMFSNIKQIIHYKYKTNDKNEIQKYMQEAYTKYISLNTKDEIVRKLRFAPKPWHTRKERKILEKFKIKRCFVNLQQHNEMHKVLNSIIKNPNKHFLHIVNKEFQSTPSKDWNDALKNLNYNRKTKRKRKRSQCNYQNDNDDGGVNVSSNKKFKTTHTITDTISLPKLNCENSKNIEIIQNDDDAKKIKEMNPSIEQERRTRVLEAVYGSIQNGDKKNKLIFPGLEKISSNSKDRTVKQLNASKAPSIASSTTDSNETTETVIDLKTQQSNDLENLTLTSKMICRAEQQKNTATLSNEYVLLDTIFIQPNELNFEEFLKYTNIEEFIKKKLREACPSNDVYEKHLSNIRSYSKEFYKNYFISKDNWPEQILLRKGALRILQSKNRKQNPNNITNLEENIPEVELPDFLKLAFIESQLNLTSNNESNSSVSTVFTSVSSTSLHNHQQKHQQKQINKQKTIPVRRNKIQSYKDIPPSSVKYDEFRKLTNIEEIARKYILYKHFQKSTQSQHLKQEKYIKSFYKTIFLRGNKWPCTLKLHQNAKIEDFSYYKSQKCTEHQNEIFNSNHNENKDKSDNHNSNEDNLTDSLCNQSTPDLFSSCGSTKNPTSVLPTADDCTQKDENNVNLCPENKNDNNEECVTTLESIAHGNDDDSIQRNSEFESVFIQVKGENNVQNHSFKELTVGKDPLIQPNHLEVVQLVNETHDKCETITSTRTNIKKEKSSSPVPSLESIGNILDSLHMDSSSDDAEFVPNETQKTIVIDDYNSQLTSQLIDELMNPNKGDKKNIESTSNQQQQEEQDKNNISSGSTLYARVEIELAQMFRSQLNSPNNNYNITKNDETNKELEIVNQQSEENTGENLSNENSESMVVCVEKEDECQKANLQRIPENDTAKEEVNIQQGSQLIDLQKHNKSPTTNNQIEFGIESISIEAEKEESQSVINKKITSQKQNQLKQGGSSNNDFLGKKSTISKNKIAAKRDLKRVKTLKTIKIPAKRSKSDSESISPVINNDGIAMQPRHFYRPLEIVKKIRATSPTLDSNTNSNVNKVDASNNPKNLELLIEDDDSRLLTVSNSSDHFTLAGLLSKDNSYFVSSQLPLKYITPPDFIKEIEIETSHNDEANLLMDEANLLIDEASQTEDIIENEHELLLTPPLITSTQLTDNNQNENYSSQQLQVIHPKLIDISPLKKPFTVENSPSDYQNIFNASINTELKLPAPLLPFKASDSSSTVQQQNTNSSSNRNSKGKISNDNYSILQLNSIPKQVTESQYGYISYLNLHRIHFKMKRICNPESAGASSNHNHANYIGAVGRMEYNSGMPFLQILPNYYKSTKTTMEATIKLSVSGYNELHIYNNVNSLKFLLGLNNSEYSHLIRILKVVENFEYNNDTFKKSNNDNLRTNNFLPYRILYNFFKTLPKFSQIMYEIEDNSINHISLHYFNYKRPVKFSIQNILESMKKANEALQ